MKKTISHNSKSVNRNNSAVRTGYSESDQIMARALMTPDELRRMDNNECIIFEKGLKPIKAKKYWYFKTPMIKDFNSYRIDHNNYECSERGNWRKYNPYNPYTGDENANNSNKDVKVESLDDLFEDAKPVEKQENQIINNSVSGTNLTQEIGKNENIQNSNNIGTNNLNNTSNQSINILPGIEDEESRKMQDISDDEIDIQKELEAKFDELFGSD